MQFLYLVQYRLPLPLFLCYSALLAKNWKRRIQSFASVQHLKMVAFNPRFMNIQSVSCTVLQDAEFTAKSIFLFFRSWADFYFLILLCVNYNLFCNDIEISCEGFFIVFFFVKTSNAFDLI